jgi:ubiquinone/menaquinone biosynthesis C-methylase UbiE
MLTEKEKFVTDWYEQNALTWAGQRKKLSEPSFWAQEYEAFKSLRAPEGKLLEIGSGSGREARALIQMGYEYTGIDTSAKLIEIAKQTEPAGRYFQTSVYDMSFPSHSFDAFTSWSMLPHVPKERIKEALTAIWRVLKIGGMGFIAMREGSGESQEEGTGRWFSYYLQGEFEAILKQCGFDVIQQEKKFSRVNLTWLTFLCCSKYSAVEVLTI